MPIDINTAATTRLMIRTYFKGVRMRIERSSGFWALSRRHIHEQPQILFATFFSMNPRRGPEARSDASFNDLVGDQWLEPDVVKRA
jgi:hypothetical protein